MKNSKPWQFKKGSSGNPNGRPRVPEDIREARKLDKIAFDRTLNKFIHMPKSEFNNVMKQDISKMEQMVGRMIDSACAYGDHHRLNFILDRLIGKVADVVEVSEKCPKDVSKVSFMQFCETAGYPKPFPKQLEMRDFGLDGPNEPKLLLGYRGCGKTDYVTIMGVAYDIYLHGISSTNLIVSKSKVRNRAMIEEIANALIKNGVELDVENSECIRIKSMTGKDHSAEVLTVKSSFRGRHPKRIIFDDVVTEEDTSEATRVLVKKKYDEAYKLSKNILIVGQPAHKFDLHQELRPKLIKMEVPWGSIPELQADLDAMRIAGVDENSIQMSYFLNVQSEDGTPFGRIRYIDQFIPGDSVAFIDPSFEGGDYTAISIVKGYMDGVCVVGFTYKKAWEHCLDEIHARLTQFGVKKLCFETNSLGDMPIKILREQFNIVGVVGRKSNGNKHSRILAAGAYSHLIHLSKQSDKTYLDQVVKYEYKSKYDDAPDSLASCLEWIGLIRGKQ
jgi:hypothetical protein